MGGKPSRRNGGTQCVPDGLDAWGGTLAVTAAPATSTAISTVTVVLTENMTVVETVCHTASKTENLNGDAAFYPQHDRHGIHRNHSIVVLVVSGINVSLLIVREIRRACSCAGILPTAVTPNAPSTTITVEVTNHRDRHHVLDGNYRHHETDFVSVSTTTLQIVTTTVTPACLTTASAFEAVATEYNNSPLRVYANFVGNDQQNAQLVWAGSSSSPVATIQNKYIWALDGDGNLILANPIPPYTYKYYAYISTSSSGSAWAQVGIQNTVQTALNNGRKWANVKGCTDSATGKLPLDAGSRKNTVVRRPALDVPGQWRGYQSWRRLPDTAQDLGCLSNSADGLPSVKGDADDA
ncbi:hypothetical protein DL767_008401 [Monosporascus sp. MG133]|nr:hypothetical protein DL767_008401 [Monosporascus sp. MG133]